ncbi:MAG TPA: hypothetical protein VFT99_14795, partial [Roseiflexaceae bacterium]|nr:hypothetical protein [Roseiflexaceae bacterium]
MNRRRWFAMMLLFTLLVCAAPAQAADPPLLVEEEDKPGPILSEDEVARIRQLQTIPTTPLSLSAISPDDAALLVATANGIGFMSVEDGTITPVDRVVRNLNPSTLLLGLYGTPVAGWRNERVLQYWTTLRTSDRKPQVALVSLDRVSGQIQASAVDVPPILHPVSLAPNASRLLLVEEPPDQETGDSNPEELGYVELPSGLPMPAPGGLSAAQRAERNAVLQANPWLVPFVPEWLHERGTMAVTNDVLRLWVKD